MRRFSHAGIYFIGRSLPGGVSHRRVPAALVSGVSMHETRSLHDGGSASPNIDRKSKTNESPIRIVGISVLRLSACTIINARYRLDVGAVGRDGNPPIMSPYGFQEMGNGSNPYINPIPAVASPAFHTASSQNTGS